VLSGGFFLHPFSCFWFRQGIALVRIDVGVSNSGHFERSFNKSTSISRSGFLNQPSITYESEPHSALFPLTQTIPEPEPQGLQRHIIGTAPHGDSPCGPNEIAPQLIAASRCKSSTQIELSRFSMDEGLQQISIWLFMNASKLRKETGAH